jgi:hypothetical protein
MKRTKALFRWLLEQVRSPDNWLVSMAVANWLHIFYLSRGDCRGIAPPWYCYWTWYGCANRLLVAALCVRFRRTWFTWAGFLVSAHIVASQLFYFVNPDEFSQMLSFAREYEAGVRRHFIEILFEHSLIQGLIAALIVIYAMKELKRRISGGRPVPAWSYAITLILLVISAGYLSSFISHGRAESETAQWLYRDVLQGGSLNGDFVRTDYLKESAGRFTSVGAKVIKVESDKYQAPPWGEVGPSYFTGPFLISVNYLLIAPQRYYSGKCLIINFFGLVKILDKDSLLWLQPIPYLWPY